MEYIIIYNNINYINIQNKKIKHYKKTMKLTKKQFRNMIKFEGLMYGIISAVFSATATFIIQFIVTVFLFLCYYHATYLK